MATMPWEKIETEPLLARKYSMSAPDHRVMSALPPKADMDQQGCDGRFVP
jgi:hypothetical protein